MTQSLGTKQPWFIIVRPTLVFCGMRYSGTLIWESRTTSDPIQPVLFPYAPALSDIPNLPDDADIIHLEEL